MKIHHIKEKVNLTKSIRVRLVSAVRCAVRMRSQPNVKNAAKLLEKDIKILFIIYLETIPTVVKTFVKQNKEKVNLVKLTWRKMKRKIMI